MKFDVVIGNPPYNSPAKNSEKTIAGTSGNTVLYRLFIDRAFKIVKEGGFVGMVTLRNGIRYAQKKYQINFYELDTSRYWDFSAGWFVSKAGCCDVPINVGRDGVVQKVCTIDNGWNFRNALGGSYNSLKNNFRNSCTLGSTYGIVELPSAKLSDPIFAHILKKAYPQGPKLLWKGLESKKSYYVTDYPSYVGSACCLFFNSNAEADNCKQIILHSKLIKYINTKLKEKTLGHSFTWLKKINLTKTWTDEELYEYFGLTQEEINYIESNVK